MDWIRASVEGQTQPLLFQPLVLMNAAPLHTRRRFPLEAAFHYWTLLGATEAATVAMRGDEGAKCADLVPESYHSMCVSTRSQLPRVRTALSDRSRCAQGARSAAGQR